MHIYLRPCFLSSSSFSLFFSQILTTASPPSSPSSSPITTTTILLFSPSPQKRLRKREASCEYQLPLEHLVAVGLAAFSTEARQGSQVGGKGPKGRPESEAAPAVGNFLNNLQIAIYCGRYKDFVHFFTEMPEERYE